MWSWFSEKPKEPKNSHVKSVALTKLGFCHRLLKCQVIWSGSVIPEGYCCPCLGLCVGCVVNASGTLLRTEQDTPGACAAGANKPAEGAAPAARWPHANP